LIYREEVYNANFEPDIFFITCKKNITMYHLNKFESEDIIFHYTKTTTALEHILYNKKLRLSDRVNSNDPIENMKPFFSRGLIVTDQDELDFIKNQTDDDASRIEKEVRERIKQIKQVCFCMNDTTDRFNSSKTKPLEFYGCMKPRMWEQYGDNYSGVCLIFSKNELLKQLDENYKQDFIKYVGYNDLKEKDKRIDLNILNSIGYQEYRQRLFDEIDEDIFKKHEDYIGENEYRICSYSDEDILEISIKSALKGIVVSGYNSQFFNEKLDEYGTKYNIDVLKIGWEDSGVQISNPRETLELVQKYSD